MKLRYAPPRQNSAAKTGLLIFMAITLAFTDGCSPTAKASPPATPQSASQTQFVPLQHIAAAADGTQEHDALFYPDSERDFYPNQQHPHRAVMRPTAGGSLDLLCMNDDCNDLLVRTNGLKGINDGSLQLTEIDPKIFLIRDGTTQKNLGYLAQDSNGNFISAKTLAEAQSQAGEQAVASQPAGESTTTATLKTVGKVALGALVVTALVAGALAEGAAQAKANSQATAPTYTNCTRFGNSVNCTSY
jgi:hypothetical protein